MRIFIEAIDLFMKEHAHKLGSESLLERSLLRPKAVSVSSASPYAIYIFFQSLVGPLDGNSGPTVVHSSGLRKRMSNTR